ncbi:8-oxo-dGTP diphosphatase [Halopolyspora algeriensis]|uniref:8-oxo-dGTP diphosphatase n=1 Tax=Halopolyspora algeriensis TaxID=1500506 RepID=A0A368VRE8_9ACTN|nr:NUDIX domain-containing protein [Halopolyspora algeriensis]RCW44512.1 8-oxo-dGTP diphosphatase [Halopolyspora algeriensis]TQM55872.1 8-oxo-dGTP diphosphatase [Halopolyspora algeriensis]
MGLPEVTDLTRLDAEDGVQQQAVGAVVDHEGSVLLLQRPAEDVRSGEWELPSGAVEPGEDLMTALRREITEETGLVVSEVLGYLGAFDYTSDSGMHTRRHTWSVTVTGVDEVDLSEHEAHMWVGPSDEYPISAEAAVLIRQHFHPANT